MPHSVLSIDDDAATQRILVMLIATDERLRMAGLASNGQEALDRVRGQCPDAIICDWHMPVMDGLSAIPRLRLACPDTVIVVYSAANGPELRTALDLGADAALDKTTLDPAALLDQVAELCDSKRPDHDPAEG